MRKRKGLVLLGMSLVLLGILLGSYCYQIYIENKIPVSYRERIMGIPVVDDLAFLDGKEPKSADQNPGILFEQTRLPYTSDGTLYLAQDYREEAWIGELTTDSPETFICMLPDSAWTDKAESIQNGHRFQIYLVGYDFYYPMDLVICGMPVMSIQTEREEEQDVGDPETDPDHYYYDPEVIFYGQTRVFNPGTGVDQYEIIESGIKYYPRGGDSSTYSKGGYSIGLLDAKGKNLDVSLLGMRADNSWKLKAMVIDKERLREKTACQIWEQFASVNTEVNEKGPRMEYLELIFDNEYMGLYCLIEPVDSKKLELDENDVLYRPISIDVPEDEDIEYAIDLRWRIMSYLRIRYPKEIRDYRKAWYPMRDYLNTFYRHDAGTDLAADKVYITNVADMLMFNMAVSGSDNIYKNMYFAADVSQSGEYVMRQIPWDLDLTFGAIHAYGGGIYDDETVVYEEAAGPFLRDTDPEVICPYIREHWVEVRNSFLSTENIFELLHENQDYLIRSGVLARENARWPEYPVKTDLDDIESLLIRRMEWLDEYFASY